MVDRAGALANEPAADEHCEVRDALDLVALRKIAERIGVDLEYERLAGEVVRRFLDLRRDAPARATPGRPEVHEHRHARRADDLVELILGRDFDRARVRRKRRMALAALARVGEMADGDAVDSLALGADTPHLQIRPRGPTARHHEGPQRS